MNKSTKKGHKVIPIGFKKTHKSGQSFPGVKAIHMKYLTIILFVLLSVSPSSVAAAPFKGAGSKVEAFGKVMGTYALSLSFTEVCREDPAYKNESEQTAKKYLDNNQDLVNELNKKINQLAAENGGAKEQQRINSEIKKSLLSLKSQTRKAAKQAITDQKSCSEILANIRNGNMDLKTKRSEEIAFVMDYTAL